MLIGLTVHLIRFKHKFEFDYIALGLMLVRIIFDTYGLYAIIKPNVFYFYYRNNIRVILFIFISTAKVTTMMF